MDARALVPSAAAPRLPGLRLASEEPWAPRETFHVHGPTRLPIRFEPGKREGSAELGAR